VVPSGHVRGDRYNPGLVFEIGNSLREARLRQGLDFPRVEADTKIRGKYLQALEAERFEVLPAETYVKGFLRTYAEYLGLDGQLYVDEYNSRFAATEEPLVSSSPPRRSRQRASESSFVVVALAGIVAATLLVVVAFAFNNGPGTDPAAELGKDRTTTEGGSQGATGAAGATTSAGAPSKPRLAKLVLTAARGDCWVEVHKGSATGELVYSGTMEQGQTQRFVGRRLWVTMGDASVLDARLNGKRVANFPLAETVVVSAQGVRAQA
jgi:cytoskeleton protein RodZ